MSGVLITVSGCLDICGHFTDQLEDGLWRIELATQSTAPVSLAICRVKAEDAASTEFRGRGGGASAQEARETRPELTGVQTSVTAAIKKPLGSENGPPREGGLHAGHILGGDLLPPGDGLLRPHLQPLVRGVFKSLGVG